MAWTERTKPTDTAIEGTEPLKSQCLSLNGSGYAAIGDASQVGLDMGLSDFMIEANIRSTNTDTYNYIIYKLHASPGYFFISSMTTGYLYGGIDDGVTSADVIASNLPVIDGQWHIVHFVVDRSSSTGLKLFVGGVETTYGTQEDPTLFGTLNNSKEFKLGLVNYCTARLDELRIWKFGVGGLPADYAAHITWRYTNPFASTGEYNNGSWNTYVTNNLSAYYKLNGDYTDETSNNNDLTAGGSGNTFLWYGIDRATERADTGGPGYDFSMTNIFWDRTDIYFDSTTTGPTQRTKPIDNATQRTKPTDTWTERTKPT